MKIAYIYFGKKISNYKSVSVKQILNTIFSISKNINVTIITGFFSNKKLINNLKKFSLSKNFDTFRFPLVFNKKFLILEKILRLFFCIYSFIIIKIKKFDIVYTRDFSFLLFHSFIPKIFKIKIPIIFEAHVIYAETSKKVNQKQEIKGLLEASRIITISNGIKKDLIKKYKFDSKKIFVAPDGVNLDKFLKFKGNNSEIIRKNKITKKDNILLYAGSFQYWKGVETLIKSIYELKNTKLIAFKTILVGGYGKDYNKIKNLVNKLNLKNEIIIEKFVSEKEIIALMKKSTIGIIPNINVPISSDYTSPLKLFEYMACGLPIIASDLPSMREILVKNRNCLFFEPENAKDLAKKIDKLLKQEKLLKLMRLNNIEDVKKYSWDERAKKIIEVLKNV